MLVLHCYVWLVEVVLIQKPITSKFYFNVPSMEFWLQIHQGTLINLFSLFSVACLMKWILLLTFVCCCQMLATQFLTWARYDKNEFTSSWNPSMNQWLIRKGPTKTDNYVQAHKTSQRINEKQCVAQTWNLDMLHMLWFNFFLGLNLFSFV